MDDAERTDESAEDITAALTAPRPKKAITPGVRYCNTMGRIILMSSSEMGRSPG